VVVLAITVLTTGVAMWPTTRYVAIDRVVREETLPLWLKTANFVDRDLNFARVAAAALGGQPNDEARALAALSWTLENVRRQPPTLPTRDDHVWFVVVRGYGEEDQQADVFTTLLVYRGVPAFWGLIGRWPDEWPLSYVRIDDAWRVFDVANGLVFRTATGALATPEDIAADRSIIERAARDVGPDVAKYLRNFEGYAPPEVPEMLRAEMQMPGRRLVHEVRKLVGMETRVWNIRPHPAVPQQGAWR
jgi:hypothetical protein